MNSILQFIIINANKMDKQQAAEKYALKRYGAPKSNDDRFAGDTEDGTLDYIAGWEAREAQSPTDAIEFAIWLREHVVADGAPKLSYKDKDGHRSRKTIPELYKLFNPSGAVPQADGLKVETGYKKGLQGWTAFFTIGVQTFSLGDLESEERARWYKEMLDIAFANLSTPAPPAAAPENNEGLIKALDHISRGPHNGETIDKFALRVSNISMDVLKRHNSEYARPQNPAGPVWVKEIDWINREDKLPPIFKSVLCASKNRRFVVACVDASGDFDENDINEDDRFAYWAYITSPWDKNIKQEFTREQVEEIINNIFSKAVFKITVDGVKEYMNTNYPPINTNKS